MRRVHTLLGGGKRGGCTTIISTARPFTARISTGVQRDAGKDKVPCLQLRQQVSSKVYDVPRGRNVGRHTKAIRIFTSCRDYIRTLASASKGVLLAAKDGRLTMFTPLGRHLFIHILPKLRDVNLYRGTNVHKGRVLTVRNPFSRRVGLTVVRRFSVHCLIAGTDNTRDKFRRGLTTTRGTNVATYIVKGRRRRRKVSCTRMARALSYLLKRTVSNHPRIRVSLVNVNVDTTALARRTGETLRRSSIIFKTRQVLRIIRGDGRACPFCLTGSVLPILERGRSRVSNRGLGISVLFSKSAKFCDKARGVGARLGGGGCGGVHVFPKVSSISCLSTTAKVT